MVLSVIAFVREKYDKRLKHPRFGCNKVAVAGPSGVAEHKGQLDKSGGNDAPLGRVFIAIEVFGEEEGQKTLNANSRVEVASSIKLFNKRSNPQQVELSLHITAGPSGIVHRPDRSAQSSRNDAPSRQKGALKPEMSSQIHFKNQPVEWKVMPL